MLTLIIDNIIVGYSSILKYELNVKECPGKYPDGQVTLKILESPPTLRQRFLQGLL